MTVSTEDKAADESAKKSKKLFRINVPTAFTILFFLTVIAVFATWFVPAGQYSKLAYDQEAKAFSVISPQGEVKEMPGNQETLDDLGVKIKYEQFANGAISKPISIPGTYERLNSNPAGVEKIPLSMIRGTMEAVDIMVFIFTLGGLIGVVRATGSFESGLMALTKKTKGHEFILVFAMSLFMVVGGTLCGLEEEAVAFYPIMCPIFIAMGYDTIIAVGAIFLAGSMGTTMSTVNPFSVVIASNAAGIPFTEGLWWRVAGCVVGAAVVIGYLYWYAKKIKANPEFSYTWEDHESYVKQWGMTSDEPIFFNWKRKLILVLFFIGFPIMVWGVMTQHWAFPLMASSFLTITLVIIFLALIGKDRLNEKQLVDAFSEGASSLVAVSLIIGLARGINMVLNEGYISDTILDGATHLVSGMSGPAFIIMLLLIFFVLGFVVPSSSGLAVLSMPIMAPLADSVGIPRWVIVCAYQWGQYAMLYLAPTGLVMATLQMLDMKYSHWFKFVWPMVVFVLVFGGGMLVAQTLIYGV
ncbi:YfcC family protein [Mobiluncus mulieris]|uniref:C4-dicarboxylate anaerobic carrier n=2 Tax=Mobiluncus mulieris TaxID=2052 RepID=E0QQM0_9ACTO|nr:YfcC family protein [Mobiluncus mulieris]EFM46193.1 C4-dicarboxylate anaerobic carrier [Mobiluncus mulieris ATCC 35239]MCU9971632.1 YfcC family protein [Mobiluncus mulieris]MCU9976183.1 YfcC family protein [Mobiluncus mulieris]MCU9994900.1 YfcC family protein [Mobiluncus mulieris]MCU9997333.1 YfcC family protein [Mobiluncus mulieris]